MNLGYACINMTLGKNKPKVTTNRSMIKRTFLEKGIDYAGELSLQNARDLFTILEWNNKHNIKCFRLSSDIFPWASEYGIENSPYYKRIETILQACGKYATDNGIRITSHPGPFNVLVSPREHVVENTITDLSLHGKVFDMLGLSRTPYNKLNIHCNGVYGDKISAMDRFCKNFERLPESVQTRLTVENDDKASMYSVKDLMYIHERIGIPIVFDYHHHKFNTGDKGIKPMVHYSESKRLHEGNDKIKVQAHSDYINELPNSYGNDIDVMVEAKAKELSILPYINSNRCEYSGLLNTSSYEN
jgi:UV DNA damage endonuclease